MRHIRDPITGYCIICEKNNIRHFVAPDELEGDSPSVHGQDRPRSNGRGGYDTTGKKTIHVASSSNGSDPGNKSGKSTSLSRPSSSASLNSDDYNDGRHGSTARSTSKLIIIERNGSYSPSSSRRSPNRSPNRSPSPALKSPKGKRGTSPPRRGGRFSSSDPESGCCGKTRCCKKSGNVSKSRVFDESTNYNDGTDRCCGYSNSERASYGSGTWGIRRWCAPLLTLLVLGALAGIAAGIYFGVKSAKDKAAANQRVVGLIKNSQATYIIVGTDQKCVSVAPRASTTTQFPLCSVVTTKIITATPRFVPPTDPDWLEPFLQYSSGSKARSLPVVGLLLLIWAVRAMLVDRNFNSGVADASRTF